MKNKKEILKQKLLKIIPLSLIGTIDYKDYKLNKIVRELIHHDDIIKLIDNFESGDLGILKKNLQTFVYKTTDKIIIEHNNKEFESKKDYNLSKEIICKCETYVKIFNNYVKLLDK